MISMHRFERKQHNYCTSNSKNRRIPKEFLTSCAIFQIQETTGSTTSGAIMYWVNDSMANSGFSFSMSLRHFCYTDDRTKLCATGAPGLLWLTPEVNPWAGLNQAIHNEGCFVEPEATRATRIDLTSVEWDPIMEKLGREAKSLPYLPVK